MHQTTLSQEKDIASARDIHSLIKASQAKIAKTCQLIEKSIHRIEGTQYIIAVSEGMIQQKS